MSVIESASQSSGVVHSRYSLRDRLLRLTDFVQVKALEKSVAGSRLVQNESRLRRWQQREREKEREEVSARCNAHAIRALSIGRRCNPLASTRGASSGRPTGHERAQPPPTTPPGNSRRHPSRLAREKVPHKQRVFRRYVPCSVRDGRRTCECQPRVSGA